MSQPRSLLDLPAETRLRIYDFVAPGHGVMQVHDSTILALLRTCKLIYDELLVFIFASKTIHYNCTPKSAGNIEKLSPRAKGLVKSVTCWIKHGLTDVQPIWPLLRHDLPRLTTLDLVFSYNYANQGISTLLDLATLVSKSEHETTKEIVLALRCPPLDYKAPPDEADSESKLQEMQKAAVLRHAMYSLHLPANMNCIYIDFDNSRRLRWAIALPVLRFAGGRSFVKSLSPSGSGMWLFKLQVGEGVD